MLLRFFVLVVLCVVGVVVAVAVKSIVGIWLPMYTGGQFGDLWQFDGLTAALVGVFPIVYIIFSVFINPARKFLRGENPADERKKRKFETTTPKLRQRNRGNYG